MWTSDDDVWASFLTSLDPDEVERERFGTPGPDERPNSPDDLAQRKAHTARQRAWAYKRDFPAASKNEIWLMVAEAAKYDDSRNYAAIKRARAQNRKAS